MTASRKKRVRPSRPRRRPFRLDVDLLDGLIDHCHSIMTLAGLLQASGSHAEAEPLESALVGSAGHLIFQEAEQLRALLDELGKGGAMKKFRRPLNVFDSEVLDCTFRPLSLGRLGTGRAGGGRAEGLGGPGPVDRARGVSARLGRPA